MPKVFTSEKQKIGEAGENIAERFLVKQGFRILDRNYTKKWGEIDIVAEKASKIYFIEVKSVSSDDPKNFLDLPESGSSGLNDDYRAEDNMHPWKMQRLARTIQTYLLSKNIGDEKEWQVDLFIVYLNLKNGNSSVKVVSDIIL